MVENRMQGSAESDPMRTPQHERHDQPQEQRWLPWCRKKLYETFVYPLAMSLHPPWYDARGVAMGLAVGLGMPVGIHTATLALLRSLLRFNLLAALAFSCVSNPFNMIPLYYGYYRLGCLVLGKSPSISLEVFHKLMRPVMDSTYFWEATSAFLDLGKEILAAWFVAAAILALTFSILGYVLVFRLQSWRRRRRTHAMGLQYEKALEGLERPE